MRGFSSRFLDNQLEIDCTLYRVFRLVIKPGTERNEMERNETKRNGKEHQARHRVHFSWTQSNAEGVWTPSKTEGCLDSINAEAEGPSC